MAANFIFHSLQVSSLLSMSAPSLRELLCDPKGCHVADAFAESASVGEKSRDGLVKALKVRACWTGQFIYCNRLIWRLSLSVLLPWSTS